MGCSILELFKLVSYLRPCADPIMVASLPQFLNSILHSAGRSPPYQARQARAYMTASSLVNSMKQHSFFHPPHFGQIAIHRAAAQGCFSRSSLARKGDGSRSAAAIRSSRLSKLRTVPDPQKRSPLAVGTPRVVRAAAIRLGYATRPYLGNHRCALQPAHQLAPHIPGGLLPEPAALLQL